MEREIVTELGRMIVSGELPNNCEVHIEPAPVPPSSLYNTMGGEGGSSDDDDNEDDDDYVSSNKPLLSFRMVPVKSAHVDLNGPKALHRGDSWGLSTL